MIRDSVSSAPLSVPLPSAPIETPSAPVEVPPSPTQTVSDAVATVARHPVAFDIPRDLPVVPVDAKLMERVFMSLIGNVPKHTPAGTHVTVSARREGDGAAIVVQDDGPGIPDEARARVFDPYFTTKVDGTGLGLAIVKKIAEQHGGSVSYKTKAGKGTTFTVRIPA